MEPTTPTLLEIVKNRRSTRNFSNGIPPEAQITDILESAVYAPYGGATGIPLDRIRRIFVFRQGTGAMEQAHRILLAQMRRNAKKLNRVLRLLPFLKPKMQTFANRVNGIARNGIPALDHAAYFIVLAEKKGFPPVEKQSMAHAMQNMWLTATGLGLGFQLVSATGTLSANKDFMALLGLEKGSYALDGCAVGYPKNPAERQKEFESERFVKWME